MIERPILFSAPMVRAILAGTKTQTRRAVHLKSHQSIQQMDDGTHWPWEFNDGDGHDDHWLSCRYGQAGDRLWVRETWAYSVHAMAAMHDDEGPWVYAADGTTQGRLHDRWHPSIHMRRCASRITLEVTGVRVERLQDISEADALAEGIVQTRDGFGLPDGSHFHAADPRQSYWSLWEAINGPGSVAANPWVWVVEFCRNTGAEQ